MRDAIQGMLNMSQLPTVTSTLQPSAGAASPFIINKDASRASLRLQRQSKTRALSRGDDLEEALPTAYKDDEFSKCDDEVSKCDDEVSKWDDEVSKWDD